MKTLALISQKGGAGKSTLGMCLAVEAERKGLQTLVLDADPQGSLYNWFRRREGDTPYVKNVMPSELIDIIREADELGVDFCVIDTPGRADASVVNCARIADLILVPTGSTPNDLRALGDSFAIAQVSKKPYFSVINRIRPNSPSRFNETRDYITAAHDNVHVFPYPISDRVAYSDCMIDGGAPQEFEQADTYEERAKASREIKILFSYIANQLELDSIHA